MSDWRTEEKLRATLARREEEAEDLQRRLDAEREMRVEAEARAERLEAALREIDSRTGHFGEPPAPPEWMPMLSLIAWVGKTARATLAEVGE